MNENTVPKHCPTCDTPMLERCWACSIVTERDRYRAALQVVAEADSGDGVDEFAKCIRAAREALKHE